VIATGRRTVAGGDTASHYVRSVASMAKSNLKSLEEFILRMDSDEETRDRVKKVRGRQG